VDGYFAAHRQAVQQLPVQSGQAEGGFEVRCSTAKAESGSRPQQAGLGRQQVQFAVGGETIAVGCGACTSVQHSPHDGRARP